MPVSSANISSGTSPSDAGRYVADRLIERSELHHMFPQMLEDRPLPTGMSKTAFFIRYERTDIPLTPLSEGVTPAETPFSITEKSVTVDEWGMYITLTDVVVLTTQHPVLNEGIKLVGDAIARIIDSQIVAVLLAGTQVQYFDGSGTPANRAAITTSHVFNKAVFAKAIASLRDLGTPEKDGTYFWAVLGPQVEADILNDSSIGGTQTWVNFDTLNAMSGKVDKLEKGVVGAWLGIKLYRTNFIPKFVAITGITPTATTGGSLSGTVFYKVTRLSTQRGFEEGIQAEANVAMAANTRLQFTMPSTVPSGGSTGGTFVYNVYAGTVTGDSNLKLAIQNAPASSVVNLDSVPSSGANPPAAAPTGGATAHPVFIFGEEAGDWVPLDGLSTKGLVTPPGAQDSDPLAQRRKAGSKFMAKAGIRDQNRLLRIELGSAF